MSENYPPTGFHFLVQFNLGLDNDVDARFQSVSGISTETEYEEVREGGLWLHSHQLPVRTKNSDLVLKRGIATGSGLNLWFDAAFKTFTFVPATLQILLLNEQHDPLKVWAVFHALPKKVEISEFNAERSEIVIETLTLSYNTIQRM